MADPFRDQEHEIGSSPGRESRIEELLLAGLDHYFSGQHDLAISVWTRVLFLDRSHARARAYIERARGAIAERQREGEELLQTGIAAFHRGDVTSARRLLTSALDRSAQPEEARALIERIDRIRPADGVEAGPPASRRRRAGVAASAERRGASGATLLLVLAVGLAAGALVMIGWNGPAFGWMSRAPAIGAGTSRPPTPEPLPVPSASEVSLGRAAAWVKAGRPRDAMATLDTIRPDDPLRPRADDLRAAIQQQLLEAAHQATRTPAAPPSQVSPHLPPR